ncbi:MAG: universal stress protein [Burkholderiaceae bacterium]
MKNENKVLACVDQSRFADCVADYAAWAATRLGAPLEFLHVIDRHPEQGSGEDHSGAIGIDAQENLLSKLSAEDEARTKDARERGRVFLNRLRQRATASGATSVDVRQRYGELEETLVEQAAGVRLLVIGRRGEAAGMTRRDLGRNVERVVRALHRPILTVSEDFREPRRVMIAFRRGLGDPARCRDGRVQPLVRGIPIDLLMSGKKSQDAARRWSGPGKRSIGRIFAVEAALVPGDAETVIARAVKERSIDMLIMGAFGHSPLRSLLFGSKTADLLRSATIPTLLLR